MSETDQHKKKVRGKRMCSTVAPEKKGPVMAWEKRSKMKGMGERSSSDLAIRHMPV